MHMSFEWNGRKAMDRNKQNGENKTEESLQGGLVKKGQ